MARVTPLVAFGPRSRILAAGPAHVRLYSYYKPLCGREPQEFSPAIRARAGLRGIHPAVQRQLRRLPVLQARCRPGATERRWTRERLLGAMIDWRSRYGKLPSSYVWSGTHARRRGGEALERLAGGEWPAASVVTRLFATWAVARVAAWRQDGEDRQAGPSSVAPVGSNSLSLPNPRDVVSFAKSGSDGRAAERSVLSRDFTRGTAACAGTCSWRDRERMRGHE